MHICDAVDPQVIGAAREHLAYARKLNRNRNQTELETIRYSAGIGYGFDRSEFQERRLACRWFVGASVGDGVRVIGSRLNRR
jgi:hypothetical protein